MENHRVISTTKALALMRLSHHRKKKVVFTNGCFDIIHSGHVKYLEVARSFGDILIVGLNSDVSVRTIKGPNRPITNQKDRAKIVASLYCVDYVIIFNGITPAKLISKLKPDIYVKGGDYLREKLPEAKIVDSYGGTVRITKYYGKMSTTLLIQKINKYL